MIHSLQLTAKHKVATPVDWKQGGDVIIVPSVSDADAEDAVPRRLEDAPPVPPRRPAAEVIELRSSVHGSRKY